MLQKLKKKQEGFTIIEVMIVLVIAAVILLIVFLAVPALQRNSRNTQLKNDVGVTLGYINEYASNNNGNLPYAVCSVSGSLWAVTGGTCSATGTGATNLGKIGAGTTVTTGTTAFTATSATGTIQITMNAKCGTLTTPANRAIAASYVTEGASTNTPVCQDS